MSTSNMVLDLSKSSAIKRTPSPEPLPLSFAQHQAAIHYWNEALREQIALDLSRSPQSEAPCDSSSYSSSHEYQSNGRTNDRSTRKRRNSKNSGSGSVTSSGTVKDDDYLERRLKNNLSAKRSRDAKREREAKVQAKVVVLEKENRQLKAELAACCSQLSIYKNYLSFFQCKTTYD